MKSIIITGASGNLGLELQSELKHENIIAFSSQELDVTDLEDTRRKISKYKPSIIFHCAAKTDLDWCETHEDEAFTSNVEGTKNVLKAAQESNCTLIFPSTYYVYGGLNHFPADDRIHKPTLDGLLGVYSRSKLLAELEIEKYGYEKYFVVRLGSLFGGKADKKFVNKILSLTKTQDKIEVVTNRWVQPSYIKDTVQNLLLLVSSNKTGTYNMVGHGIASFYEYAEKIKEYANLAVKLIPITVSNFNENAPRAIKLQVTNGKLQEIGLDRMRDWKIALEDYIKSINDIIQK